MSVLQSTLYEQLRIWDLQGAKNKSLAGVMSVVAFSGGVVTPPHYIRIDPNPALQALGGFTYSGVVSSIALIGFFDTGVLRYLFWYDFGCFDCGGVKDKYCISGVSAALFFVNCDLNYSTRCATVKIDIMYSASQALHYRPL